MRKITKKQEIKHLVALRKSNSYFRDSLGIEQIDLMIENIKNDYPINIGVFVSLKVFVEVGITLGSEIAKLKFKVKEMEDKFKKEVGND